MSSFMGKGREFLFHGRIWVAKIGIAGLSFGGTVRFIKYSSIVQKSLFWPIYLIGVFSLGKLFFKSWKGLLLSMKYMLLPDAITLWSSKEFSKDENHSMRFYGFIFSSLILLVIEYKLVQWFFPDF